MKDKLQAYQDRVNKALSAHLKNRTHPLPINTQFFEAIEYATLNKGKRIRPALAYAIAEALDIPLKKVDSTACALELIHSYSLVHDDLPAMDDDDLRRGQPTTHIQYNEAFAILVGDAQQTLAFDILANDDALDANSKVKLTQLLCQAAGANGMIAGQVMDIESTDKTISLDVLECLHQLKTGAMITTAMLMGAAQSPKFDSLSSRIETVGKGIGLAFQVHDDILDIESDTETLGKPQGSDQELNKSTYPKLLGLSEAKAYRDQLIKEAKISLTEMGIKDGFLHELADYIAARTH